MQEKAHNEEILYEAMLEADDAKQKNAFPLDPVLEGYEFEFEVHVLHNHLKHACKTPTPSCGQCSVLDTRFANSSILGGQDHAIHHQRRPDLEDPRPL